MVPNENKSRKEKKRTPEERRKRKKRRIYFFGTLLIVFIGIRIWLPYYIKNELVSSINEVEGYSCKLDDVDLVLFKGKIVLEGFEIYVTNNKVPEPFVMIPKANISIDWSEVLDGAVVGEIHLKKPHLYFSDGESDEDDQIGGGSWVEPILDFIPVKINVFTIEDGKIEFENKDSKSDAKVNMHHINLVVTNLRNTDNKVDSLPSNLKMSGKIYRKGNLTVDGRLNVLKEVPDMDLNILADDIDLRQLNSLFETYAALDFESGTFGLATEFVMKDSEISGYLKPTFDNVSIFNFKEKGTFLNLSWQAFAGFMMEITENQRYNRSATKVPFEGTYEEPDYNVLILVLNVFRNSLFKAYQLDIENTISFENAGRSENKNKLVKSLNLRLEK